MIRLFGLFVLACLMPLTGGCSVLGYAAAVLPGAGTKARYAGLAGQRVAVLAWTDRAVTYRASNGAQPSNIAQVEIGVGQTNHAPNAGDDEFNVQRGGTLDIAAPGVLSNDNDPDGDALTAILRTSPAHGTLTFNADGAPSGQWEIFADDFINPPLYPGS